MKPIPIHLPGAKPCPFCGSTRIVKGERYFAMCVDCGATGPERNADASQAKFIRDWNARHDEGFRALTEKDLAGNTPEQWAEIIAAENSQPPSVKGIPAEQSVTGATPAGNNGGAGAASS
jgi:Lar family restriction alleviation protein